MKKFFRIYNIIKCIIAIIAVLIAIFAPMFLASPKQAAAAVASPQQAQSPVRQNTATKTPSNTTSRTTINRSTTNVPAKAKTNAIAVKAGSYAIDEAGALTASQFQALEKTLAQYTARTGTFFGVAVRNAGMSQSAIGSYANQLADQCAAKSQNGAIVFVQDTKSRLWYIATDKKMKAAMPKNEHVEYISNAVVPYLKSNDTAAAYRTFAEKASELAAYYTKNHKAMQVVDKTPGRVGIGVLALGLGYMVAAGKRSSMVGAMSNVRHARDADDYVKKDSFNLTTSDETFLYNTVRAVPRPKNTSGGGRSGGVSFSSSNSSHGGGGGSY